jgi:hypothetical protein
MTLPTLARASTKPFHVLVQGWQAVPPRFHQLAHTWPSRATAFANTCPRPFHELCPHLPKSPGLSLNSAHTWPSRANTCPSLSRNSAHTWPRLPSRAKTRPRSRGALPTLCSGLAQGSHELRPSHHPDPRTGTSGRSWGRDRIGATWAESQWIVAARPLCHLQYPVAYLSRLQRILPAARREFLQGVPCGSSAAGVSPTTRAFGGRGPYCWSANGRRAHASLLARILT